MQTKRWFAALLTSPFERPKRSGAWAIAGAVGIAATLHFSTSCTWAATSTCALFVGLSCVLAYTLQRDPTPDTAAAAATLAGVLHFVASGAIAASYAAITYPRYLSGPSASTAGADALKDWFLASGFVGGLFALFRSSRTNSSSLATLRLIRLLEANVERLGAIVQPRGQLLDLALRARSAGSPYEISDLLGRMITIANGIPDRSKDVDALSLWMLNEDKQCWEILTGDGVSQETMKAFTQPVLAQATDGAGIVANLALENRPWLIVSEDVERHPWFKADPAATRELAGLVAVPLVDRTGKRIGAVCLTSCVANAIPSADNPARAAFEDVLPIWSAAFTLPLERMLELRSEVTDVER